MIKWNCEKAAEFSREYVFFVEGIRIYASQIPLTIESLFGQINWKMMSICCAFIATIASLSCEV